MPDPQCPYSQAFGARFRTFIGNGGDRVAKEVVDRFLKKGYSAFISDGSSTFAVGLELGSRASGPLVIRTTNLALAMAQAE